MKLEINAYANTLPAQQNNNGTTKLDGWGEPLQTVYLHQSRKMGHKLDNYDKIKNNQLDFFELVDYLNKQYPNKATELGWNKTLPAIANDPECFTIQRLSKEVKQHYSQNNDVQLSWINRQNYLVKQLADYFSQAEIPDFDPSEITEKYGIDITFKNPDATVLNKFYNNGVLTQHTPVTKSLQRPVPKNNVPSTWGISFG